jgi:CrcB protein
VDLRVPVQRWELAGHRLDVLGAIALGGILGAEARYGLSVALPHASGAWPWATLLTNLSGCLLIGVLMAVITELIEPHRLVRPFLGVGVLGGYTTFSTYSTDLVQMLNAGRPVLALGYLAVTPLGALAAVWAGTVLIRAAARLLARRFKGDL